MCDQYPKQMQSWGCVGNIHFARSRRTYKRWTASGMVHRSLKGPKRHPSESRGDGRTVEAGVEAGGRGTPVHRHMSRETFITHVGFLSAAVVSLFRFLCFLLFFSGVFSAPVRRHPPRKQRQHAAFFFPVRSLSCSVLFVSFFVFFGTRSVPKWAGNLSMSLLGGAAPVK